MSEKIRKLYNPFKMWGSWAGFVLGLFSFSSVEGFFQVFNPFAWIMKLTTLIIPTLQVPLFVTLLVILTTPIVFFLYGWGIQLIFRTLGKKGRLMLVTLIVLLIVVLSIAHYIQRKRDFKAANPYYNYSVTTLMSNANNKSFEINKRLTMLEDIRIQGMSLEQKKKLSEQLSSFDLSQLSEMNKSRMEARISILQQLLATK